MHKWDVLGRLAQKGEVGEVIPVSSFNAPQSYQNTFTATAYTKGFAYLAFTMRYDIFQLEGFTPVWNFMLGMGPGAGETEYARLYNDTDGEAVTGSELVETAFGWYDTGWFEYEPPTTDSAIFIVIQYKTDPGANGSVIKFASAYFGLRID